MKILIAEKINEDGLKYLREEGFDVDIKIGMTPDELLTVIGDYDAIIVRSATKVISEVVEKGTNLKVVGRAGNGIDNIDVPACTKKGIMVVNTPESNIMAAAELAVAHAYALFRNIPQAYYAGKKKDFRRNNFVGAELDGKTAGIIGFGRIGGIVASKLKGINMKVVAYDPFVTAERFEQAGVTKCETIDELLAQSDLVTIHTPKIAGGGIIGAEQLAICKKGARIVNCARGGLIDEKALYVALKSGHIAGVALDVLEKEPNFNKAPEDQDYTNPLFELDNVIYTPHLGASTNEANYNVGVAIAKIVGEGLKGEMVPAVNMPPLKGTNMQKLKPYIDLAESLGKIFYQAEKGPVIKIEVIYSGDLVEKDTRVISLSALKGLLASAASENVNYVNVEMIAKNMGIELLEGKSSMIDKYTNLITINFYTKEKEYRVAGTVFAKEEIRIVDFFGYKLDFEPTPYIVAIQNMDKPGIIGKIGTVLGLAGINIAAMQWSRNKHNGKAVAFVSIDADITQQIIDDLVNIEGVVKVSLLKF
jgi:D-3-phosphoglycerate dehydrogenase